MKKLLLLPLFLLLTFCGSDDGSEDCSAISCEGGPNLLISVINKTSGENLFSNETYTAEDVTITDANGDTVTSFEVSNGYIYIQVLGVENDINTYILNIANDITMTTDVELIENNTTGCCSYPVKVGTIDLVASHETEVSESSIIIYVE
ncbi:hypothetical protein KO500_02920 [Cellulophaga baltica]|uniref:hypothetical protein n=1 Tax=Cellulophaga TaxID=104264 RepID=UPI001C06D1EB|nr:MULTISPECIES: hypothetical protein [Cellulophaga]MBU2995364.1 hypothetical protein [Cellulophaga baltica]MDO6766758.1 hypothetical protein [Cellulophaga sp. 1_MG-2023]